MRETRAQGVWTAVGSTSALRAFWHQTALLLFVLAFVNGSNYAFHVVVSRMLGPGDYGALAALLAVVLVLSVPFTIVQTAVADKTATLHSAGRPQGVSELAASALKTTAPFAVVAGIVVAIFAPLIALFLHVDAVSALLLAPYVTASIPVSVAQGVLQGSHRFQGLATLQLATTLLRLGLGVTLVWAGLGVAGAVLATALAAVLTIPIALRFVHLGRRRWARTKRTIAAVRGDFGTALLGLTSFWALAEADIALARHFLDADDAGYYSSAGLLARALLFVPAAVAIVAFPRFVAARGDEAERMRWLRVSTSAVGVVALGGLAFLVLLREPLTRLAFGDRFAPAADLLPIVAIAMGWFAVIGVLVYFHIAMSSRAYVISFAGLVLEVFAIWRFHATAEQVALVTAVVAALVAFFQYQAAASICRWRPEHMSAGRATGLRGPADLELSVVVPCYNAGSGLRDVLERLLRQLAEPQTFEIIVVSDGSTDETGDVARALASEGVRVIEHPVREGKGHALRLGLQEARGRYVAFCDADGDISPDALQPFVALMRLYEPDVVIGSKRHPLSDVYYPPLRRLLSWTYHKLVRVLFRVNVRDTQTGFKLIRRDVLVDVLPRLLEKRYAFDLEFLVVARSLGYGRVFEAPVKIEYRFASKVDLRETIGIGLDTLAIFYRHYILNTYRQRDGATTTDASANGGVPAERAKVLVVNWRDVKNPEAGGAEIFAHEVARRWVAQGHEVTQLASRFPGAPRTEIVDGVRIRRRGRLRTGSFHAAVQWELARLRGYDLVVESVNTIPFLTPWWSYRLPTAVVVIHQLAVDVWDAELPRPLAYLGRKVELALLRLYRNAPVVVGSESTGHDLRELGFGDIRRVKYGRDSPPDVHAVPKEPVPTFLFVGRLAANKRPDHAVRAFASIRRAVPDARLWLVGTGPMERELRSVLPAGAELLGRLPRDELYRHMARAHCLLVPSVREGWGLVVIEANSVGTPAVGYDIPGVRDSIRAGRTGVLAPAGDPDALAQATVALVENLDRYEAMREAAVAWAEEFSWDATAAELLEIARSLPVAVTEWEREPTLAGRAS